MTQPRHGGNLVWAAGLLGCSPCQILDFSASINPLGPPQSALQAIQAQLQGLRAYPDPQYRALRQVLSQVHGVPEDWVLPGNGVAELLTWVGRDLAGQGCTHLCSPAFRDYERALSAFGAEIQSHPLSITATTAHPAALEAVCPSLLQVSTQGAQGVLLNNPHNPTGQLFARASILKALQHFAWVVVDEAFMDFLPPARQQSVVTDCLKHENLIVLRSLTKFYSLPGLRLGYAIASPTVIQRWQTWRDPWAVNVLADAAGQVILKDQAFQAQTWAWLPTARQQLLNGLAQLPGLTPLPGAVNFLLVASTHSVIDLQRRLLNLDRILIRDCHSFPELGDGYFRVAVRTEAENQRLLDALAVVLNSEPLRRPMPMEHL